MICQRRFGFHQARNHRCFRHTRGAGTPAEKQIMVMRDYKTTVLFPPRASALRIGRNWKP